MCMCVSFSDYGFVGVLKYIDALIYVCVYVYVYVYVYVCQLLRLWVCWGAEVY